MTAPFTGGCACGAVRYEASAEPRAFIICHCSDCQRASGGGPANMLAMARADVTVTKGADKVKTHQSLAESGNKVKRDFCPNCGSPLFASNEANPDFMGVRAGTLDDPSWLTPNMTIWTASSQPWAHIDPNLPKFEKGPQ